MTNLTSRMVKVSNPEKKIFAGYTKEELVEYYRKMGRFMLPHIKKRLVTMFRFPNGADKEGFFQKEIPDYFPSWIEHVAVKKKHGQVDYIVCNDMESIIYVASQVSEIHIATSTIDRLDYPDKMMFDFDPPGIGRKTMIMKEKIKKTRNLLKDIGLHPYVMTTGKKGYHIAVPILPEQKNEEVREFALKIANVIENDDTANVTTKLMKDERDDRIFIDVNRNSPKATSIAPYSVRATTNATVALPVNWNELGKINPDDYDIKKSIIRMKHKTDPWKDFGKNGKSLKKVLKVLKK
jgi:bifunctional non-homologous end joining protein LigD